MARSVKWTCLRGGFEIPVRREHAYNAAYPPNTARFGNLAYKLLLTASGLSISFISLLGLVGFLRSLRGADPRVT